MSLTPPACGRHGDDVMTDWRIAADSPIEVERENERPPESRTEALWSRLERQGVYGPGDL